MSREGVAAILLLVGVAQASAAHAHKPSDSYLRLTVAERGVSGEWDIALRDLDHAIGLDDDGDGAITWGELRRSHDAIAEYATSHLTLRADGSRCATRVTDQLVDTHADGTYTALRFVTDCPASPRTIAVAYRLFADVDPLHRGLLRVEAGGRTQTAVLGPDVPEQSIVLAADTSMRTLMQFMREGVRHIWLGYDHVLFLIVLLLPAVLRRDRDGWHAVGALRPALTNVLALVTAFTLAHSLTLGLATLRVVSLPTALVESTIAISIAAGAINNLFPIIRRHLWLVAFAFGLVHGFGFANVLGELDLPRGALALALVGFNGGVELGQLVIVAVFVPIAYVLRRSWLYQRVTLGLGSGAIAALAFVWAAERALDWKVLPF